MPTRPAARPAAPRRATGRLRRVGIGLVVVLVLALAWPIGLLIWADGLITHTSALSGGAGTPGVTYLLAGSDARGGDGGIVEDGTLGARTDTIMVLHDPSTGPTALISLPRDTYVEVPGHGPAKLNAAYALGGAPLLVETVEQLTGLHVDHYVEVGLGGVTQVVDAVGGVTLCLDPSVDKVTFPVADTDSGLFWDVPGCRLVDGTTAVAFARMRKADAEGDLGRARRQQQVISAVSTQVADRSLLVAPTRQVALLEAGLGAVVVDEGTGILDLGRLALAFRSATGPSGVRGTPPIADPDYRPGDLGSTVLLDPESAPAFWQQVTAGTLPAGAVGGLG